MATPQSKFIIRQNKGWGGPVVDSQYLGAAYNTGKPHVFANTMMRIYSSQSDLFNVKPLTAMTGAKVNGYKEIDGEIYRWYLQGAEEKSARSIENLEAANVAPGLNLTPIRLKLDLDFYRMPDVLMPEDNNYALSIIEGPIPAGNSNIYVAKLQTDNPAEFLPNYLLDAGREFNKVWTSVSSEANSIGGTQQYPSSFQLEAQVSAFAQQFTVTDKAWRDQGKMEVEFSYTDMEGKTQKVTKFLAMAEAKMWDELIYSSLAA